MKWSTSFEGSDRTKLKTGSNVNASAYNAAWSGLYAAPNGKGWVVSNTIFPLAITTTRIVLKGATFIKSVDYAYLCGQSLTGPAVRVRNNGDVIWSATGQVLGKLPTTTGDVTLDLPTPLTLTYVLGMLNGTGPEFTVEAMELY